MTEKIMDPVRQNLPEISTHTYNRVYESVLKVLSIEYPPPSRVVRFPGGGGIMF